MGAISFFTRCPSYHKHNQAVYRREIGAAEGSSAEASRHGIHSLWAHGLATYGLCTTSSSLPRCSAWTPESSCAASALRMTHPGRLRDVHVNGDTPRLVDSLLRLTSIMVFHAELRGETVTLERGPRREEVSGL